MSEASAERSAQTRRHLNAAASLLFAVGFVFAVAWAWSETDHGWPLTVREYTSQGETDIWWMDKGHAGHLARSWSRSSVTYGSTPVLRTIVRHDWNVRLDLPVAVLWLLALAVARVAKRYAVGVPERCAVCHYDLRATPDRCPECGTPRAGPVEVTM